MTRSDDVAYEKPLPSVRKIDEPYWEGTLAHELRIQRCLDCGKWWHPPSEFCPQCLGHHYEWATASGRGTIWSRIFMHQLYYKSFASEAPYNIVWVALDEGPMMTANIVGSLHEDIEIGSRVAIEFEAVTDAVTLPRFRII